MEQMLLVLLIIGVGIWMVRRGGCCGMRKADVGKPTDDKKMPGCH